MISTPTFLALTTISIALVLTARVARSFVQEAPPRDDFLEGEKRFLHPEGSSLQSLLYERSKSNKRLVRALKLTNTFVLHDSQTHSIFVSRAQRLLQAARSRGPRSLASLTTEATEWQLSASPTPVPGASHLEGNHHKPPCNNTHKFHSVIQNVTLAVVLTGILDVSNSIEGFHHQDITLVSERITTLWALSKHENPIPPHLLEELNEALRRLIPDQETFPNPLDFVIPTWETLWRVIAITIAYVHSNKDYRELFRQFHEDPTDGNLKGTDTLDIVSVHAIISEVMRLHPPSKRIGRVKSRWWIPKSWEGLARRVLPSSIVEVKGSADVEGLLRDVGIWGEDAEHFRPERHHTVHVGSEKKKECLKMVFGHGPLKCIAASWVPLAVASICSSFLDTMTREGYIIRPGGEIGSRDGWNDWFVEGV